jgi:hypothetical protein
MTRTLLGGAGRAVARAVRGIGAAVRGRLAVFGTAVAGALAVSVLLPPLVLSLARKPCDYFTLNPWLASLPHYLVSADVPLGQRVAFLPNLALFWFSSDNPWGVEWGVAVTVADLLRFLAVAVLFGAYLALWVEVRDRIGRPGWPAPTSRQGGLAAALAGVLGFSTGSCSVMGCGAPVMPVVGLAFTGLASGTIKLLSAVSAIATAAVVLVLSLGVGYFGWLVDAARRSQARGAGGAGRPATP